MLIKERKSVQTRDGRFRPGLELFLGVLRTLSKGMREDSKLTVKLPRRHRKGYSAGPLNNSI